MLDNSMFAPKEKIEYVVAFQANPEYTGEYQKGMWTDKVTGERITNVYGRFRSVPQAIEAVQKCIKWCCDEPYPTYRTDERGKTITEWKTRRHDNIIIKIYKFVDGMNTNEEIPLCEDDEKPASKSKKKEPQAVA